MRTISRYTLLLAGVSLTVGVQTLVITAQARYGTADTGTVRFVTPNFTETGGIIPQHTARGDFNGDGALDAVEVNAGPSSVFGPGVAVALGDGKGRMSASISTDLGGNWGACDIAVGNWNGDSMDDLVVQACTTSGPGPLMVLVATGGGHFTVSQTFNGSDVQIVAGDFNSDQRVDFVTSQRGSSLVTTYLGHGDGTFQAPFSQTSSFDSYDLETGDVNNDGKLDLVGASGGPVWTMRGKGDGTFADQMFHASQVLTGIELAVTDLNNDGKLDVAVVDASGGHLGIGLGNGTGTFSDGDQIETGSNQVTWVAAGEVTKDAKVDLVVGLDNDSTASALYAGKGNGHFKAPTHWVVGADGLTTGDFTGDGRDDLLTWVGEGRIYLSVAQGKGFHAARLYPGPNSEDLLDVNGDHKVDKVSGVTGFIGGKIRSMVIVQLGRGNGTFGKPISSPVRVESAGSGIGDIDLADINADGILDIAGGFENFQPSPNNLFWMLGDGSGSFKAATLSNTGDPNADVDAMALADVNADGRPDIVANDLAHMVVRLGNGKGSFGAPMASGVGSGANRSVLVGDFTGDGLPDIVTTVRTGNEDFGQGEIRLQRGDGTGMLTLLQTQNVASNLNSGTSADLNSDGRPDIVTAGTAGFNGGINAMYVLLTTPGGRLGNPTTYAGPYGQVATGDVDVDGDLDIATTGSARIDFYLNDGTGRFPKVEDILASGGLGGFGRLNADPAPDVIAGGPLGEFAVHLNAR